MLEAVDARSCECLYEYLYVCGRGRKAQARSGSSIFLLVSIVGNDKGFMEERAYRFRAKTGVG